MAFDRSGNPHRARGVVFLLACTWSWGLDGWAQTIESQVRTLFQARCLACHGAELREGGLRLTSRADVLGRADSGELTVVPGDPEASVLWQRVASTDPDHRMPPEGDPLSKQEVALIRQWIKAGAAWADPPSADRRSHWAYQRPAYVRPTRDTTGWARTPIDHYVLSQMPTWAQAPPSPEQPARLLRRVYLDLIGLPPSTEEVNQFVARPTDEAYAKVVERLLSSPRYGEKWARHWLDLARYSDSNGYQADQIRELWAFRDWVIDAMNADMPFDQFTIEQLAGDLLPEATHSQIVATGFHRATTCNVEAGVDPEGNRTDQVIDRVNTTGTTWLGTTLECAQCHNHKYDPITQQEYYELFAFFNNTPIEVEQQGPGSVQFNFHGPKISLPLTEDERDYRSQLQAELERARGELKDRRAKVLARFDTWLTKQHKQLDDGLPANIRKLLELMENERKPGQTKRLRDFFVARDSLWKQCQAEVTALEKRVQSTAPATTLVMQELETPRQTQMFLRGSFLSPGANVAPDVPRVLHPFPEHATRNRLGLARWLTADENPLTARVVVNRWWREFFGRGIVRTVDDFGTQGDSPSHLALLDWLALELQRHGWSMKAIHRCIVSSSTYRQSANILPAARQFDPENIWLTRGPRGRMPAELIRDNALSVSGLLVNQMGGPPVFPPQPPGLWNQTGRNEPVFKTAVAADRFRRGVYVIWRRAAPYPSFVNFDAPDRMTCVAQRSITNTPLQALTLLNDEAFVEMALAMAARVLNDTQGRSVSSQVEYAMRLAVARTPTSHEVQLLVNLLNDELERLRLAPEEAEKLVSQSSQTLKIDSPDDRIAWAAWFCVCNGLLNLDETISK